MRVFVTGAGGFLGAAVVRAARADGHQVTALVRHTSARLAGIEKVDVIRGDLGDRLAVSVALRHARPDVVVHTAWAGLGYATRQSFDQFAQVETSWRLVEAAAAAGATRFVGIGSQDEYGPTEGAVDEGRRACPVSAYGAAKLAAATLAQETARQCGIEFAWLRLFATYGPGDSDQWLIPSLTRQMLAGIRPRTTLGTQRWDYLYIDDAARGVLAAALYTQASGIFNLSSGSSVTVKSIIELIRDAAAPDMDLVFGEIAFNPLQIMHMEGVNDRLRTATGWEPRIELEAGIAHTVAALRSATGDS